MTNESDGSGRWGGKIVESSRPEGGIPRRGSAGREVSTTLSRLAIVVILRKKKTPCPGLALVSWRLPVGDVAIAPRFPDVGRPRAWAGEPHGAILGIVIASESLESQRDCARSF